MNEGAAHHEENGGEASNCYHGSTLLVEPVNHLVADREHWSREEHYERLHDEEGVVGDIFVAQYVSIIADEVD